MLHYVIHANARKALASRFPANCQSMNPTVRKLILHFQKRIRHSLPAYPMIAPKDTRYQCYQAGRKTLVMWVSTVSATLTPFAELQIGPMLSVQGFESLLTRAENSCIRRTVV